ncbi:MAG: RNA methyltransferase [Bacteroidales bacterium]|nr:RNA methyltransferase [Bacteroidales bacterium]
MLSNKEIKYVKELQQKKFRKERQEFIIEGKKMVTELLSEKSPFPLRALYVQEEALDVSLPAEAKIITPAQMKRISGQSTPSGALAVVSIPSVQAETPSKGNLYLALDGIQDPGNFGTLLRIADWFNVKAIYASYTCVELYNPKTVQATMGAVLRVPVYYIPLAPLLQKSIVPVLGSVLQGGENIYTLTLPEEGIVVLGNESQGISPELMDRIQTQLYVPSYRKGSESLNVATAAAVICAIFRKDLPPTPRS